MTIIHKQFELAGIDDSLIRGDLRVLDDGAAHPVVVVCHGFKGFKNWGGFPYLCEELAKKGLAVVIFNFSHNGVGASLLEFDELERFSKNTLSLEVEDLERVLEALGSGDVYDLASLELSRIVLVGHSRGGNAVLRAASKREDIAGVLTLASVCDFPQVSEEEERSWRAAGVYHAMNARTGQQLPLGVCLLDDMLQNAGAIEEATRSLRIPLRVIHGTEDPTVPLSAAEKLSTWCPTAQLEVLEGAGHTFGVQHPFQRTTDHFERVISSIHEFVESCSDS